MGRRKRGNPIHGWVVIDKPVGLTSTDIVTRVRRALNAQKAGHAGTLDPLATGLLCVALGEATKTIPYIMDAEKTYRFTACWGEARATDDREGMVTETSIVRPHPEQIIEKLNHFVGEIEQTPPAFSAVKVDGERAYDLARAGEAPDLKPRAAWIARLELRAVPDPDHAEFEMVCGKGTYVRSFVRDLARSLGTVGHVAQLRRTATGPFREAEAIPLDKFIDSAMTGPAPTGVLPLTAALDDIPALGVSEADVLRLRSGASVVVRGRTFHKAQELMEAATGEPVVLATAPRGEPVALAALRRGELVPVRVFNFGS
ncbi:MAG: tRNA pseudouridine(55) synthase TruB [Alphaproteobacteria bacterium]|nr:tRNA pseudouridine(55) synthase TruB [Alphaproteobacteria bacterium]